MPERKPRGRPRLNDDERKQGALAWRPSEESRKALEEAAQKSGRTLSQEMEDRMLRTVREDALVGADLAALLRMFASAANLIEARMGAKLFDNDDVFYSVRVAWLEILEQYAPPVSEDRKSQMLVLALSDPGPPPEMPAHMGLGLLSTMLDSELDGPKRKQHEDEFSRWQDDVAKWQKAAERYSQLLHDSTDNFEKIKNDALEDARVITGSPKKV